MIEKALKRGIEARRASEVWEAAGYYIVILIHKELDSSSTKRHFIFPDLPVPRSLYPTPAS